MRKSSASKLAVITALGICVGAAGALATSEEPVRWETGCGLSEPKVVEKVAPKGEKELQDRFLFFFEPFLFIDGP